jgi:GT2 family glycosyltransferase
VFKSNTKWSNVQKVGYVPGALLFTKYTTFENLGFFDEGTFLFCEERFTGKVVMDAGLNNYIITDLTYLHEHSKTIKNEASDKKQRQWIHEGRLKYHTIYSKNPLLARVCLNVAHGIHELELKIISFIKK